MHYLIMIHTSTRQHKRRNIYRYKNTTEVFISNHITTVHTSMKLPYLVRTNMAYATVMHVGEIAVETSPVRQWLVLATAYTAFQMLRRRVRSRCLPPRTVYHVTASCGARTSSDCGRCANVHGRPLAVNDVVNLSCTPRPALVTRT